MTSVPCPPRLTLKADEAALTLKSTVTKVAVTDCAAFIVTEHVPVPVQAPLQPVKAEPAAAVAVSVTVPLNDAEQVVPQLIPAGLLVTVPEPLKVTVRGSVITPKVAVTDCAAFMVTAHVPVPLQPAPRHPVNVDPEAGVAVSVRVLLANVAEQAVPQLIPAGLLVTLPVPDPLRVTESGKV